MEAGRRLVPAHGALRIKLKLHMIAAFAAPTTTALASSRLSHTVAALALQADRAPAAIVLYRDGRGMRLLSGWISPV